MRISTPDASIRRDARLRMRRFRQRFLVGCR